MDPWNYVCPGMCVMLVFGWVTVAIIRAIKGERDPFDI